ncbi:hypothetical protein [uncultured Maricaulis sp.]|uniref:DUF7936 family protein n=1 Tax=uncultured Maricaulis sp. TaxID=174710 RepID=UPI0030DA5CDD|tara:strand:- start:119500 stop:119832 length:333 start_codon:yes stop_codon:yes gene_type:complete
MANEHEWNFGPVDGKNKDGLIGVVTAVHWQLVVTDEDENTVRHIGVQTLGEPDPGNFEARLQVPGATPEEVQTQRRGWLGEDFISQRETAIDLALAAQLEAEEAQVFREP